MFHLKFCNIGKKIHPESAEALAPQRYTRSSSYKKIVGIQKTFNPNPAENILMERKKLFFGSCVMNTLRFLNSLATLNVLRLLEESPFSCLFLILRIIID